MNRQIYGVRTITDFSNPGWESLLVPAPPIRPDAELLLSEGHCPGCAGRLGLSGSNLTWCTACHTYWHWRQRAGSREDGR